MLCSITKQDEMLQMYFGRLRERVHSLPQGHEKDVFCFLNNQYISVQSDYYSCGRPAGRRPFFLCVCWFNVNLQRDELRSTDG